MKKYLIGNMKMNQCYSVLEKYFDEIKEIAEHTDNFVGVCVPNVYLNLAKDKLAGSKVRYGVENVYHQDKGAYTGEVSVDMLKDFDTELVIVGHSERRQMFGDTDKEVNKKVKKVLSAGMTPILCYGESLEERKTGLTEEVVLYQLEAALSGLDKDSVSKIIFAYEPIWAIGTGVSATDDEAEEICKLSKDIVRERFGCEVVVLYGGSMKPANAKGLLSKPSIDGGLIGGACLKTEDFNGIINY